MPNTLLGTITPFAIPQSFDITITQTANDTYIVSLPFGPVYGFEELKEAMAFVTEAFAGREKD